MTRGSKYRTAPASIMISIAVLAISFLIIYLENDLDLLAYPGKNNDNFGISELYPTVNKGETWFFNSSRPIDGQFDPNKANITKNSDGSWHLEPGITRMLVFTKSSGDLSEAIRSNLSTYNYSQLSQKGYWYKPTDWKNVEITGYFRPLASEGFNDISLVSRSV